MVIGFLVMFFIVLKSFKEWNAYNSYLQVLMQLALMIFMGFPLIIATVVEWLHKVWVNFKNLKYRLPKGRFCRDCVNHQECEERYFFVRGYHPYCIFYPVKFKEKGGRDE